MKSHIAGYCIALLFIVTYSAGAATYGGGIGTSTDPFQIREPNQMNAIGVNSSDWDKHFKLMSDIDMSAFTGTQYNIIGDSETPFIGTFDGNGHVIRNLTYTTTEVIDYVGLFSYASNATIQNLGLENVSISTGGSCAGGLAAYSEFCNITSCYATGSVCSCSMDVFAVGGLVARNMGGTLSSCYANCTVSGANYVGGLAGYNNGTIETCYATGSVSGVNSVGGLAGFNSSSAITSCYATGSVSGVNSVGGLVGHTNHGSITNCYSTGYVSGTTSIGGLLGYNYDGCTIMASFWDTQTSGQLNSAGGTGMATAEMKTVSTFTSAGWDFSSSQGDWWIPGNDYPHLFWEHYWGSGTADDPYQIWTHQQMNAIGSIPSDWNKHFKLMADIDMSAHTGTQYNIIGNETKPFIGSFDGNHHKILNLTYSSMEWSNIGLFGMVVGGQIKNLGLENVNITGRNYVGGLVGANGGTLMSCYTTGSVSGSWYIGGLVGSSWGTLSSCYANCTVSGSSMDVFAIGGLVGSNEGTITTCYAASSVSGSDSDLAMSDVIGGLAGYNNGTIETCYATGYVLNGYTVGGLVGGNNGTITSCYTTDYVSNCNICGGLAGYNDGDFAACFWDTDINEWFTQTGTTGVGGGSSAGVTGKTTDEMKTISTFTAAMWDFTNERANGTNDYWRMCVDGVDYPRLNWQLPAGDFACPNGVNFVDFAYFAGRWQESDCTVSNNYCGGADMHTSGTVDMQDLTIFAGQWLTGI